MSSSRGTRHRAAFITALALLGEQRQEKSQQDFCVICGACSRASSGECSFCGVYVCTVCHGLHLGDASSACPGDGVPAPRETG